MAMAVCDRAGRGEGGGTSSKSQEVFCLGGRTTSICYMVIFKDLENTGIKEYFW